MNLSMIRYVLGLVLIFEGAFLSLPCIVALIYNEGKGVSFFIYYNDRLSSFRSFALLEKTQKSCFLCKRGICNSGCQLDYYEFFWRAAICIKW